MQHKSSDINDIFQGQNIYPLENLSKSNRWVIIADRINWTDIETEYNRRLKNQKYGAGNKPARLVIGAIIIKHLTCLSDAETIATIQENPYMQYLVGLKYFSDKPIFSPELLVSIRKRIDDDFFNVIILSLQNTPKVESKDNLEDKDNDGHDGSGSTDSSAKEKSELAISVDADGQKHSEIMKIDATCTDAEVRYPTDVYLLKDASREIERLTNKFCEKNSIKKPHTYRSHTRSAFVMFLKRKHNGKKLINATKERILHLLSRDIQCFIATIGSMRTNALKHLTKTDFRNLWTLMKVYQQQKEMFDNNIHTCMNRIISIFQPHTQLGLNSYESSPLFLFQKKFLSDSNIKR